MLQKLQYVVFVTLITLSLFIFFCNFGILIFWKTIMYPVKKYRSLYIEDFLSYKKLAGLQQVPKPVSRQDYENSLIFFPEGQICCAYSNELVLAFSSFLVNSAYYKKTDDFIRDFPNGYISEHTRDGDSIFIYNWMLNNEYLDYTCARETLSQLKKSVCKLNLKNIYIIVDTPKSRLVELDLIPEDDIGQLNDSTELFLKALLSENFAPLHSPDDIVNDIEVVLEWKNYNYKENIVIAKSSYKPVKMCVVQYNFKPVANYDRFLEQCRYYISLAASHKSRLILFPEYLPLHNKQHFAEGKQNSFIKNVLEITGRVTHDFIQLAKKFNIDVAVGGIINKIENRLTVSSMLFCANGNTERQDKIHLGNFEKGQNITAGNRLNVITTEYANLALVCGYDLLFPEVIRKLAENGAQIILSPFAAGDAYALERYKTVAAARAIENQIFVAGAGGIGNLQLPEYQSMQAGSFIFTPVDLHFSADGVLSEAEENTETVVMGSVDIDLLRKTRQLGSVTNFVDKRNDLYNTQWTTDL